MSVAFQGTYSNDLFNASKRYRLNFQKGVALSDSELREIQDVSDSFVKQLVAANFPTGSTYNDGFKVVESTSNVNNFKITGGNGTVNGAGIIFNDGYINFLKSDIEYTNQNDTGALTDDDYTETNIPALTTPGGARTDEVYIDFYFAEVSADAGSEYQDAGLLVAGVGTATANRVRMVQDIRVAEGGTTPVNGTDGNGIYHRYLKIATLNRVGGNNTITNAMITDDRILVNSVSDYALATNQVDLIMADGTNIGDSTHGIGTLYMASTIDYGSDLNFDSGGTKVTFKTNGSVGIGTYNPGTMLDIRRTISGFTSFASVGWFDSDANNDLNSRMLLSFDDSDHVFNFWADRGGTGTAAGKTGKSIAFSTMNDNQSGNTEVMRISKTHRVGIGTTNPQVKLHVNGDAIIEDDFTVNGTTTTVNTEITVTDRIEITQGDPQEALLITQNGNGLPISIVNNGNQAAIKIDTDADSSNDIRFFKNTTAVGLINANTSNGLYMSAESTYPLRFYAGGDWRMIINSAGDIGVNTLTPKTKFDVRDNMSVMTANQYGGLKIDVDGNYHVNFRSGRDVAGGEFRWFNKALPDNGTGAWETGNQIMVLTEAGNLGIGITNPGARLHIIGHLFPSSSNSNMLGGASNRWSKLYMASVIDYNADLVFEYLGSEKARIKNDGKVGIGTASPQGQLDVQMNAAGNKVITARQVKSTENASIAIYSPSTKAQYIQFYEGTNQRWNLGVNEFGNQNMDYYAAGGAGYVMTLNHSSGNVGIGTTNPQNTLDIWDTAAYLHLKSASGNYANLIIDTGHTTHTSHVAAKVQFREAGVNKASIGWAPNAVSEYLGFSANGTDNAQMVLKAGGDVGIGTTNPIHNLHIYDSTGPCLLVIEPSLDGYDSQIQFYQAGATKGVIGYDDSDNVIKFARDFSNKDLCIKLSNGYVGMGTTNPQQGLHIYDAAGSGGIRIQTVTNNRNILIAADSTYNFGIRDTTAGAWRMVIRDDGSVGIGTTNPQAKLHVEGSIVPRATNADHLGATNRRWAKLWMASVIDYNSDIAFENVGSERMRLTNAGNVGIGTTNPVNEFVVYGNSKKAYASIQSTGSNYANLIVDSGHTTITSLAGCKLQFNEAGVAKANIGWIPNTGYELLGFSANGSNTPQMVMKENGRVGIGTTNPQVKLHVNGDAIIEDDFTVNGTTTTINTEITVTDRIEITQGDALEALLITQNGNGLPISIVNNGNQAAIKIDTDDDSSNDIRFFKNTTAVGLINANTSNGLYMLAESPYPLRFNAGGDYRMTITNTGLVGIGTINPQTNLHLIGNIRHDRIDNDASPVVQIYGKYRANINPGQAGDDIFEAKHFSNNSSGSSVEYVRMTSEIDSPTAGAISGRIGFLVRNAGSWSNTLMLNKNKVGIGTTNPQQDLHIYDAAGSGGIRIQTVTNNRNILIAADNTYNFGIRDTTAGAWRMVIRDDGNVGIGTTNPVNRLHVEHNAATTNSRFVSTGISSTGDGTDIYVGKSGGGAGELLAIGYRHDTEGTTQGGYLSMTGDDPGTGVFIKKGGNVGIGTVNPTHPFHLYSPAGTTILRVQNATVGGGEAFISFKNATSVNDAWNAGHSTDETGNRFFIDPGDATYPFNILPTTGEVGIGTTNPVNRLHVEHNAATTNSRFVSTGISSTGDGTDIYVGKSGGGAGELLAIGYRHDTEGTTQGGYLSMTGDDPGTGVFIKKGGYVGVGTVNPVHPFHLYSTAGITVMKIHNVADGGGEAYVQCQTAGTSSTWNFGHSTDATGNRFFIDPADASYPFNILPTTGEVGIGTTNPVAKLHVEGDIVGQASGASQLGSASRRFAALWLGSGIDYSSDLTFGSTGERLRFTTAGNVGIGTNNPGEKIDIHASGTGFIAGLQLTNPSLTTDDGTGMFFKVDTGAGRRKGAITFLRAGSGNGRGDLLFLLSDVNDASDANTGNAVMRIYGNTDSVHGIVEFPNTDRWPVTGATDVGINGSGQLTLGVSSRRYKKDIRDLPEELIEKVSEIRPVIFKMKEDDGNLDHVGFIAEELDELGLKEVVGYNSEGLPNNVMYKNMTALLLGYIKKQDEKITQLTSRIEALENA